MAQQEQQGSNGQQQKYNGKTNSTNEHVNARRTQFERDQASEGTEGNIKTDGPSSTVYQPEAAPGLTTPGSNDQSGPTHSGR
jgi:hypothetical protein